MPNIDLRQSGIAVNGPEAVVVGAVGYPPADVGKVLGIMAGGIVGPVVSGGGSPLVNLTRAVWVDANTTVLVADQTGNIEAPFATFAQAVASFPPFTIEGTIVAVPGDYSGEGVVTITNPFQVFVVNAQGFQNVPNAQFSNFGNPGVVLAGIDGDSFKHLSGITVLGNVSSASLLQNGSVRAWGCIFYGAIETPWQVECWNCKFPAPVGAVHLLTGITGSSKLATLTDCDLQNGSELTSDEPASMRLVRCELAALAQTVTFGAPGGTLEVDQYTQAQFEEFASVIVNGTLVVIDETQVPSESLTFYVSKQGNDLLGDGSSQNPFASINRACSVIRAIGNASTTNRYCVRVGSGRYTEALTLTDWTYVVGDSVEGTRVTFTSIALGPEWTANVDHRSGFQNMTVSGGSTVDFDAVSSNQGKVRFDQVTFNDKFHYVAFSAINQVILDDCFLFDGYTQTGINLVALGGCSINGNVALTSVNDGRNLPTLAAFIGCGLSSLTATWTASAGANPVTIEYQGSGQVGNLTLDGAQATVTASSNPRAWPGGVILLNAAPDPRRNLTGLKAGNAALASVCTQLADTGAFTDNTGA